MTDSNILDMVKNSTLESSRAKKMPSVSQPQARMMAGAAHDPAFAKKVGVPQKVAQDFNQADKGSNMLREAMANRARIQKMRQSNGPNAPKRAY